MKLSWTVFNNKLISFWEPPGAPSQYGDGFSEEVGKDTFESYQCQSVGPCELSRIHYVYLDEPRRNPESAEWRDIAGNLNYGAYHEYEFDAHRNWTRRQIMVWSEALRERNGYEVDTRTLSYWPQ